MKTLLLILALLLAPLLTACIPPIIDRNELIGNLSPILRLERAVEIIDSQIGVLGQFGLLDQAALTDFKKFRDVYYPYYMAANFYLATGQLEKYEEAVRSAERELRAMDKLIDELVRDSPSMSAF